ncbi:MAG: SIR2 family protein, partial [Bacteroidales bacterium]|nr:SIR2 family protein [Bacteroidales bacterium]
NLYFDSYSWSNIEQLHALDRNVCILIGLSMCDPNLRRLLDFSKRNQENVYPRHYVILQRKAFEDGNDQKNKEHWKNMELMMYDLGMNII